MDFKFPNWMVYTFGVVLFLFFGLLVFGGFLLGRFL